MLGIGPIIWRRVNRVVYNYDNVSDPAPVPRHMARAVEDPTVQNFRYRYTYPAAWLYYANLDSFNRYYLHQGKSGDAGG